MTSSTPSINPTNISDHIKRPEISNRMPSSPELSNSPGLRSAEAFVRPSPIATVGDVVSYGFDLKSCTFTFSLNANQVAKEDLVTEIHLPEYHFPPAKTTVEVTGGTWSIDVVDVDGEGMQVMRWWHGEGEQSMTVKGIKRKLGAMGQEADDEVGYYEAVRQLATNCVIM